MQKVIRLLLCLVGLVAPMTTVWAEEPVASPGSSAGDTKGSIDWPSKDGKFAFLSTHSEDLNTIDLIDQKSRKKLQRIAEDDSSQTGWHVLWAPDSNRFALMTRLGHPIQGVDVYFRTGDRFRKIDLPDLPEANIPERLKHGHKFPHFANMNWQEAEEWKKDGSLVVTIVTMIDGAGHTITATRKVVVSFDRAGKATIGKSRIKYETEAD
ncbi:hypothetical protein JQ615_03340 [Bradyrhizobium jicamae]|uniref:Uncharacterized protein n=1 Tax=Bradyrhizobium jicamae TaxID=280332 RepID=A0ABS5FCA1_9BRAD|nr:hypothetical protein [Bradyrhizobium jicamae]MBR0794417.1 hypothetical protein [Bradyrhizobium jicamae]MBR0933567.1 hypothetical protein [Bradyrhizobium jicamae]